MSTHYCETCQHERKRHIKSFYNCRVRGCSCKRFNKGVERTTDGGILK